MIAGLPFLLALVAGASSGAFAQEPPAEEHSAAPAASEHPKEEPSAEHPKEEPSAEHPKEEPSAEHPNAEHPKDEHAKEEPAGEPHDAKANEAEPANGGEPEVDEDGEPFKEPQPYDEPAGADDYTIVDGKVVDPNDPDAASYEVGEPTNDPANGLGVDGKDYQLPATDFEGMEGLDPANVKALQEVTPAELGELDIDPGKGLTKGASDQLDAQAHALEGIIDPQAINKIAQKYIGILRKKVQEAKKKTIEKTIAKANAKLEKRMNKLAMILGFMSLGGFLLLLMPLFLKKKFPGQGAKLFRISFYAAISMVGSFLLLTAVLIGMRVVQAKLGQLSNPALAYNEAVFDAVDKRLEDIAASPGLIIKPIEDLVSGKTDDLGLAIMQNAAQFKKEAAALKDAYTFYKDIKVLLDYLPTAMIALAVVLFLVSIKDMIKDIVKIPERVMKGELKETDVFIYVAKRVRGETIATLCTLGVLTLLTIISAIAVSLIALPTMDHLIRQVFVSIQYLTVAKTFDKTTLYIGIFGVMVFMVLSIVLTLVGTALFLGKSQKIFRAWFNYGAPVAKYKGFFVCWRSVGIAWVMAMPAVMLLSMSALANMLIDKATNGHAFDWTMALLPAGIALPGGYLLVFLVLFGLKTIISVLKYKVEGPVGDAAIAQVAEAVGR